jgi:hypothetical protein
MSIAQYFGDTGAFGEAADFYQDKANFQIEVFDEAVRLGNPKYIGYLMGYAFATVLHRRGMTITDADLQEIGTGKFPLGGPGPFIAGFKRFKP